MAINLLAPGGILTRAKDLLQQKQLLAQQRLADDFITPAEISQVFPFSYTAMQTATLRFFLPNEAELRWLKEHDCLLLPTPPHELCMRGLLDIDANQFCDQRSWCRSRRHSFQYREYLPPLTWLKLRKSAVVGTFAKPLARQVNNLERCERIPTAVEVAYGIMAYRRVRGVCLFSTYEVRTNSEADHGPTVAIGCEDSKIHFSQAWDVAEVSTLGLAAVHK